MPPKAEPAPAINTAEMMRILDSIARDRKIEKGILLKNLELAMASAVRKHYNTLDTEEFRCEIDPISGTISMFRHNEPVTIEPSALGRIAAQTFKQVMIQRNRDDERTSLLDEYSKRVGDIVTGTVQRYDGGSLVITLDRAEAFMPRSEQIPGEQFSPGDRVRCLCLDVRDAGSQVKIVLSRANPDFIKRLFEVEVPEVADKIIEVKAMAREPGYRTKVAVASVDSKVDPVGACVGVRGSRIKNIVDELNGEKIDIVRWNESSQILIGNALKPAEVAEISLCLELGRATVVVRDDQLSLAIGKRGQNVRLAARLTGWDVDILTPDEFNKGLEIMSQTLLTVPGMSEEMADRLAALGMVSVFDIEEVGADVLVNELGIDQATAVAAVEAAGIKAKEVAIIQQKEKEEKERAKRDQFDAAARLLESGASPMADGATPPAVTQSDDQRAADILGG
ncbi:MAG: transcription termination factor NusA [Phycisphaerales bacterium]